ncbi:2-phospho-L-lactate guanylyltransferase [Halapricum salinum]|uniref:2-phospho-L-lactate guanylyltransferase n=1 Tax=Halapricum salinum TaxID=1457250 RepID=A0A4D6HA75_9EURY|nr:2-phospho-L-lactate guanylyltransferase [Halapricum salinum]QCC50116.1 2-phospho-L-lactate guanylyltransferase [Halapricum salinum]
MHVVVPFDARDPKTRLAPVLDPDERRDFARAMLDDVCRAVEETGHEPTVLATAGIDVEWPVEVDDRSLSEAINAVLARRDGPVTVVMADLALTTPEALDRVFEAEGEVVLVPGRSGGTNVVLARHPDFRVDYHGVSIRDHRERAAVAGRETTSVDSFRLSTDVDDPSDLVEVLLHSEGAAAAWLVDHGFDVHAEDDGVTTVRRD